jgi:hypothetical protein
MAKVKLTGEVNATFEVKFGLSEDITIEILKAEGDKARVYYGKGELEKVSEKSLSFVAERIRYFLEKNKIPIEPILKEELLTPIELSNYIVKKSENPAKLEREILASMFNAKISPIREIMYYEYILEEEKRGCKINEAKKISVIRYIAENKVFLLDKDYMKMYLEVVKEYERLKNREDICFI